MKTLIHDWLNSRQEHITLFEGDDEIMLKRQAHTLLLAAQLTPTQSEMATLQHWMRLGAASLTHFQGALSRKADTGALWLIQSQQGEPGVTQILNCLEGLLNQRDTWRAIFVRLGRSAQDLKPSPLRSLSY